MKTLFATLLMALALGASWAQEPSFEFYHQCDEEGDFYSLIIATMEFPYGSENNMPEFAGYEFTTPDEGWNIMTISYDYYGGYSSDGATRVDTIIIPYTLETCHAYIISEIVNWPMQTTYPVDEDYYFWCGINLGIQEYNQDEYQIRFLTTTGQETNYKSYAELPKGIFIVIENGVARKVSRL